MSHSAGDSPASTEPVQVSRDAVTLDREIEVREEGVVVTYRLTAEGDEALSASVSDVVPEDLPTDDAGFHPDNEPYEWSVTDRDLTFETVVPDEGQRIVVFGIAHVEEADDAEFAEPELSAVDTVNPAVADEELDVTLPDVDEPARADAIAEVIQGGGDPSPDADGADDPAEADGGDEDATEASSDEIEAALEDLSEPAQVDPAVDDAGADGEDADEAADADADEQVDLVDDPDPGEAEAEAESEGDANADADLDAGADGPAPSPADPPAERDDGLVEALVAELESDAVSAADRAALAEAIGVDADGDGPDDDSLDVRLSHVQSRMDDYAAYADALKEIIDEHGTADAFMTEIREQVDLVDERVDDVHERLDEVDSRLDEVAADAADREEDVAALEDSVSELRSDVETVQRVRDTLLDAFGEDDGSD